MRGTLATAFDIDFEPISVDQLRFRYVFMYLLVVLGSFWLLLSALGLLLVALSWSWGDLGSDLGCSCCSWGAKVLKTLARCSQIEVEVRPGEVKVMSSCFCNERSGEAETLKHYACAVKRVYVNLMFCLVVFVGSG